MRLSHLDHHDPHAFLGLHPINKDKKVIRLWRPGAKKIYIEWKGNIIDVPSVDDGLFELIVDKDTELTDYKVYHHNGMLAYDPYAFWPTISEYDLHLYSRGTFYEAYNTFGAHYKIFQNCSGVRFALWAPAAKSVSLVADFNHWDGRVNLMRSLGQSGVWELFIPGLKVGEKYKFEVATEIDQRIIKTDPFAFQLEERPKTASIVSEIDTPFPWEDESWLQRRSQSSFYNKPMNVYELHAGSWRRPYGKILNYRELAIELVKYCTDMQYTHVEFLPLQEHPLDESWGYQVSAFYAVTSRFGTLQDFQWLVNHLHTHGIGVILDWVPGHFPTDDFSLSRFDGTALYEHQDQRQGFHPHWHTHIFNFGRVEVSNFLIANACFWFDRMHIDGLRVDAVASMLYLDYGRKEGEWIPNKYGGKENLESIEFFKHLNSIVHEKFPGVLMIAEESTAFPKVTSSLQDGGLGFDMKWNMGWMNDSLRYFSKDSLFRRHHHQDLTFGLLYAYSEKFMLSLSHDEVVHGKKSMLSKMPGDHWQKFANLRLLISYQICQPGKKLLFMGAEIGQWNEWVCKGELDWGLLHYPTHLALQKMVKELNGIYLTHPALWERDFSHEGFSWVDFGDLDNNVIAYLRKSDKEELLCVHHFSPNYYPFYELPLRDRKRAVEVFNSDAEKYGGTDKINSQVKLDPHKISFQLAPLATMIFKIET